MKTRHFIQILTSVLLTWTAMGCTDEKTEIITHLQPASCKLGFDTESLKMSFKAGDKVGVNETTCLVYGNSISLKDVPPTELYTLFYPANLKIEDGVVNSKLPTSQKYSKNAADLSKCPVYAMVDNDGLRNVKMKLTCGALRVAVPGNDSIPSITSATLSSKADVLAGAYKLDLSSGEMTLEDTSATELTVSGSINIKDTTNLLFALPPLTFTDSLYLKLETEGREGTCRIAAKDASIKSGEVLELVLDDIAWVTKTGYYGTANCIVVKPGTTSVTVDCAPYYTTSKNYYYENHPDAGATQPLSAKMLWNDVSTDFVTGVTVSEDGKTFTATLNGEAGNAVIAIYDKADPDESGAKILWSFHLWVTEIRENDLGNGFTVLDRNIGATSTTPGDANSIGLLYQWGRKDPFVSTGTYGVNSNKTMYTTTGKKSVATVKGGSTSGTVNYSIQHPDQFIMYSRSKSGTSSGKTYYAYDWLNFADDALWGNPQGYKIPDASTLRKSIYDPSPAGYMVPPMDTWRVSSGSGESVLDGAEWQTGYVIHKEGGDWWYPLAGWRGRKDGKLSTADTAAYYWYSSVTNTNNANASFLNVKKGTPDLKGKNCRANSCSVRSVKIK